MTDNKACLPVDDLDPFFGLTVSAKEGAGRRHHDDFFVKNPQVPALLLENAFSKNLLKGLDLFAKDGAFRSVSDSNIGGADGFDAAADLDWDDLLWTDRQMIDQIKQEVSSGKARQGISHTKAVRTNTRGRARLRRLSVEPAADTARPEAQAKKATAKRTTIAITMFPRAGRASRSKTPTNKSTASLTSEGLSNEKNDLFVAVGEKALVEQIPLTPKTRSKSGSRPTRIRAIISSGATESSAGRSPHPKRFANRFVLSNELSKSTNSCKKSLSVSSSPCQFNKSASDSELKKQYIQTPTNAEKTRSKSSGPQRSDRKKSNSSDTSTGTCDLSNSTDGKSCIKLAVKILDDSDDESSVDDIFESPPQRRKKPVCIALLNSAKGGNRLVDCKRPVKSDALPAHTGHERRCHRLLAQMHTSKESGNHSDSDILHDIRPRAPARKKSMEYEDFFAIRESPAKAKSQERAVKRADHVPKEAQSGQ